MRWHGPRRIIEGTINYVYQAKNLQNWQLDDIHISFLKFNNNWSPKKYAVMSHVIKSLPRLIFYRLKRFVETG